MFKDISKLCGEVAGTLVGFTAATVAAFLDIPIWFVKGCMENGLTTYEEIREAWEKEIG